VEKRINDEGREQDEQEATVNHYSNQNVFLK
jgi:hypothetical protein